MTSRNSGPDYLQELYHLIRILIIGKVKAHCSATAGAAGETLHKYLEFTFANFSGSLRYVERERDQNLTRICAPLYAPRDNHRKTLILMCSRRVLAVMVRRGSEMACAVRRFGSQCGPRAGISRRAHMCERKRLDVNF